MGRGFYQDVMKVIYFSNCDSVFAPNCFYLGNFVTINFLPVTTKALFLENKCSWVSFFEMNFT